MQWLQDNYIWVILGVIFFLIILRSRSARRKGEGFFDFFDGDFFDGDGGCGGGDGGGGGGGD